MSMDISIVICTYNREKMLRDTLESYVRLIKPVNCNYELLVIDNNSSDSTRRVVDDFSDSHDEIRYIFQPTPGLSFSRNIGIKESNGAVVAFVDDDIYFDSQWLVNLYDVFSKNQDIVGLGGRVIPHFETPPPAWLSVDLYWIYGVTRYGDIEKIIVPPDIPIGCNMAFRKSVFASVGVFDTDLGRRKNNLLSGEENRLFSQIYKHNGCIIYSPSIIVMHRVPVGRVQKKWILSRLYWQGISDVVLAQLEEQRLAKSKLFKKFTRTLIELFEVLVAKKFIVNIIFRSNEIDFSSKIRIYYLLGLAKQYFVEFIK